MKEQIKEWLRSVNQDRQWLADRCGVTKRTVDNWLSTSIEIPSSAARLIENLMLADSEKQAAEHTKPLNAFVLEVDEPTFEAYNRAANAYGMLMKAWAVSELDRAAQEAVYKSIRAAESQPQEDYGIKPEA